MIGFVDVGIHLSIHGEPWKVNKVVSPTEVEIKHLTKGTVANYTRSQYYTDYISESLVIPSPTCGEDDEVWIVSDWPPEVQRKIQFRLKWVKEVDRRNIPRSKAKLDPFIAEFSKEFSVEYPDFNIPSYKSISTWYKNWVNVNRHPSALMSGDNVRKKTTRIQKDLNKLYKDAIEEVYFQGPETTVNDVKVWIEGEILKEPHTHLSEEKVSLSTIKRRIAEIDEFERVARKFGRTFAINLFNSRKNVTVPSRVLEVVEIDETWADIFVIDTDGTPLGRPNIIFAIDVYSRMILSINISFSTPSSATVLHTIKQAILPKNHILDQLSYVKREWDVCGIPDAIKTDNIQHYLSDAFIIALAELGIDHIKCPVGRPNFKGIVERLFGKISQRILAKAPGYAKPLKQRFTELDMDPEKTAVFTIDEVREILYKYFVDVYCHDYQDAIEGTPMELWNDSVHDFGVRLDQPLKQIELSLRNTAESSIQNGGITFEYIQYDSDDLQRLRQRLKHKRIDLNGKKNPTVSFKYSVDDLGHIYVRDPETRQYLKVYAVDLQYADGLTYHQHKEARKILTAKKVSVVSQEKLKQAKRELLDMCSGFKNQHAPLMPKKKVAKISEKQFGSVDEAAFAIYEEFDSTNVVTDVSRSQIPLSASLDSITEDELSDILELGDDDV